MKEITIRPEQPDDLAAIHRVNEEAFERPGEANLVDALRQSGRATLSLVALDGVDIVGHILFSPVTIEADDGADFTALNLAPVAVSPARQNQGIGAQLVQQGLDECRRAGHEIVILVGHPDYYPRFGFTPASAFGLRCEFPAPDEAFMVVELRPGALAGRAGTVRYPPEFHALAAEENPPPQRK